MVAGHQHLLAVLRREKRLVIGGHVDELILCLSEKEEAVSVLARLEQRRQDEFGLLSQCLLSQDCGSANPIGRVTQLIPFVPEPYRNGLQSCQARLETLTASIVEINQINGRLVGRILKRVGNLLGVLKHLALPPTDYEATGRLSESPVGRRTLGQG
jgi:flagellar biosynthesis/type III secretory pathway chaperone